MVKTKPTWLNGLIGAVCFCLMGIVISHSDSRISSADFHFARGFFCTLFLLPFFIKRLNSKKKIDLNIFIRGVLGTFGIMISFWMIQKVGAAPARTIHSTHPLFVFFLSTMFLGETLTVKRALALLIMLTGLFTPLLFNEHSIPPQILAIGILGAFLSGLSMFMLKKSASNESESTILWALGTVQVLIQVTLGPKLQAIPLEVNYSTVFTIGIVPCFLVGLLVCIGQLSMTKSFRELPASVASSLNLLSIPLTYFIDWAFFKKTFSVNSIMMSAFIILGIVMLRHGVKNTKPKTISLAEDTLAKVS